MNPQLRQLKRRNFRSLVGLVVLTALLLTLPQLGRWLLQKTWTAPPDQKFEAAYQAVLKLGDQVDDVASFADFNNHGISQLDYDRWRQMNGKSNQDLAEIQPEEIKAIYQTQWQSGQCNQYQPPLDLTCLDSMVNFGVGRGKGFFVDLPADPQQAALKVTNRRELYRRSQLRPSLTPDQQLDIRLGIQRDQALNDLLMAAVAPAASPGLVPASPTTPQLSPSPSQPSPNRPSPSSPSVNSLNPSADQIYQQIKPITAEIWTLNQPGIMATSSGIILTPEGLILTNYHVVATSRSPTVRLADGRKFSSTVTSVDPSLDLALIQLKGASSLPTAPFAADSSQVKVGDTVYAIGSPRGKSWQMSTAEVIELNSTCANGASPLRCIRTPDGFLHPGNSGGPLVSTAGQVIGINRAIQQSTGQGVSIPVETIRQFLVQQNIPQAAPVAPAPQFPQPSLDPHIRQQQWL
jgi:S1-C subfamily serine protease